MLIKNTLWTTVLVLSRQRLVAFGPPRMCAIFALISSECPLSSALWGGLGRASIFCVLKWASVGFYSSGTIVLEVVSSGYVHKFIVMSGGVAAYDLNLYTLIHLVGKSLSRPILTSHGRLWPSKFSFRSNKAQHLWIHLWDSSNSTWSEVYEIVRSRSSRERRRLTLQFF